MARVEPDPSTTAAEALRTETTRTVRRRTLLRTGGALAVAAASGVAWRRMPAHAAPESAANLLANGDFEALSNGFPTGWRQFNPAYPVTRVTEPVHSGVSAVRLLDPDGTASTGVRSNSVAIEAGRTYQATAWVFARAGQPDVYLEFWDGNGKRILVLTAKAVELAEWQYLAVRAVAPDTATRATVLLYSSSVNAGDAVFDDVGLRPLTAAELLTVPNSDFELVTGDQPALWTQWNPAIPYVSSDTVSHSGQHSAHYATRSWETKGGFRSGRVAVTPGTRYSVTAQTLVAQGSPVISLEYWDGGNTRLSAYYSHPGRHTDEWETISTMATAPDGAVAATVMLYAGASPSDFWYDDVVIAEVAPEAVRTHPVQLTEHPRYNLGPADVTRLRGLADSTGASPLGLVGADLCADIIGEAEAYLSETSITLSYYNGHQVTYPSPPPQPDPMPPPPGFNGKYPYWSALGKAVKARLDALACAHTLTGRADFANKIKSYLTTLAGWDVWADPQFGVRADQFTGYVTQAVATAYDQVHSSLDATERDQVVATLTGKGLDLIFDDALPGGGQIGGTAPTLAMGGVVLLGEHEAADRYLTRAEDIFTSWLDYRLDGGQNEGFSYTAYSSNPVVRSLAAIERVTGDTTLSRHRFLTEHIWQWLLYSSAPPASFASFSDALAKGYLGTTMHYLNRFLDNGHAGWLLTTCDFASSWEAMDKIYWYEDAAPVTAPDDLPPSAVLPEVGEAHLRSGFTPDHALLSFRALDSVYGHNHFDQNSVQLAIGGAWLGRDPGYQDLGTSGPTAVFSRRAGHSTLLLDGNGQTQMGQGSLAAGSLLGTGVDHVRGSAAGAYVSPDLERFDRDVMRVGPNRFVLVDHVVAPEPHRMTFQLFHGPLYQHHVAEQPADVGDLTDAMAFHAHNGAGELWGDSSDGGPQGVGYTTYAGAEQYGLQLHVAGRSAVTASTRFTTLELAAVDDGAYLSAADLLERSTSPDGRVLQNAGVTLLAQSRGSLDLRISVPTDGDYLLESVYMTGYAYGRTSLEVDGVAVGGEYDPGFFALVPGPVFRHGTVHLTAGEHLVRHRSTPGSTGGTGFAVQSMRIIAADRADVQRDNGLTAEHRTGDGISGLVTQVDRDARTATFGADGDVGWGTEWVVATSGTGSKRLDALVTDAEVAVLQTRRGGGPVGIHRLGAARITRMELSQRVLAASTAPVALAVDATNPAAVAVEITAERPTTVELRIGRLLRVQGGDVTVRPGSDASTVVEVPQGAHSLVFTPA